MPEPRHGTHPALIVLGAIVAIGVLVLFPVQVLTIAMLFAIATVTMSIAVLWQRLHPHARGAVDRRLPSIAAVLLAAGIVLALAWPTVVAPVAFALTVASCVTLLTLEVAADRQAHQESHADRSRQRTHA